MTARVSATGSSAPPIAYTFGGFPSGSLYVRNHSRARATRAAISCDAAPVVPARAGAGRGQCPCGAARAAAAARRNGERERTVRADRDDLPVYLALVHKGERPDHAHLPRRR